MGILVKATENKTITVRNSEETLQEVYCRINYYAFPDGISMQIGIDVYRTYEDYLIGYNVLTDVPDSKFIVEIDTSFEQQNLSAALNYAVIRYIDLQYNSNIY